MKNKIKKYRVHAPHLYQVTKYWKKRRCFITFRWLNSAAWIHRSIFNYLQKSIRKRRKYIDSDSNAIDQIIKEHDTSNIY